MWEKVVKIIQQNQRFIITSHVNPDGDSLGSEIALYHYLRNQGKNVYIINGSDCAPRYKHLVKPGEVKVYNENEHRPFLDNVEVIFILDTTEKERLGPLKNSILASKALKVCIDHHPSLNQLGNVEIVDTSACATGELIFYFLKVAGETIKGIIAEMLYISIITDTGCFRFQNTTSKTHIIASELIKSGVNPQKVYEEIYERNSPYRMKLLGKVLSKLVFECDSKLVWVCINQEDITSTGAESMDTEGFTDILNSITGVKVSVLFKELASNRTKISLRSKDNYNVNKLAATFGGGGHVHAAGIVVDQSLQVAIKHVLEESMKLFSGYVDTQT